MSCPPRPRWDRAGTKLPVNDAATRLRRKIMDHSYRRKTMSGRTLTIAVLVLLASAPARPQASPSRDLQPALAQLDAYIRESMHKTKVPGLAVAVVYEAQSPCSEAMAFANWASPRWSMRIPFLKSPPCPSRSPRPSWHRWWAKAELAGMIESRLWIPPLRCPIGWPPRK